MEGSNKTTAGALKVSADVIATIARLATCEVGGVESLTKASVSFKQLFLKQGKNGGIKIKLSGDVVEISISVIVKAGTRVVAVGEEIQAHVKDNVQCMTGVTVSRVNVVISGVVFEIEKREMKQAL